jgi:hypothetical protein
MFRYGTFLGTLPINRLIGLIEDIIETSRFSPDDLTYPSSQRSKIPTPSQILVTPSGGWFIVFPRGCYPATRDWRGRVTATAGSEHAVPPEDAEIAAKWGNGYHHAKRTSVPVASKFSSEGDETPLDKITIQKPTYIISKKARSPPTNIKKWPEAGYTLDWPTIASLYSNAFLYSKDYHLHFRHILHRGIVTRHT